MAKYRGAYVTIQDTFPNGDPESSPIQGLYFSFGEYEEGSDTDSYGIPDEAIFYYCERGEKELRELMEPVVGTDWYVLDYELVEVK